MKPVEHDVTISTLREMQTEMPRTSPYERIVLLGVSCNDAPMQMNKLSAWVGVTQGALTTVVDRLVRSELVERVLDDSDRRVARVRLTRKGAKLIARAEKRATEIAA